MPRSFTFATITEYKAAKGNNGAIYAELVSSGIKSGSCVSKITATGDVFIDSINPFVTPELGQEGDTLYYNSSEDTYRFLRAGNTTWDADSYGQVYIDLAKIPSGFSVVAPYTDIFNFKKTDENIGSGKASMTKILGNSLAWNQKVPNGNFEEGVLHWAKSGGTIAASNNEMVWTVNNGQAIYNSTCNDFISGHKYIGIAVVKAAKTFQFGLAGQHSDFQGSDSYQTIKKYVTSAVNGNTIYFYPVSSIEGSEKNTEMRFKSVACFDLTLMFGAGNEPATVEEFEALFPLPYYAYNAGTLISNKAKAIEFVGFNQWDEEWELGFLNEDGTIIHNNNRVVSKNYIPVVPNNIYYLNNGSHWDLFYCFYDGEFNVIGSRGSGRAATAPSNAKYMKFMTSSDYTTHYHHDICINLSGKRNGQYEPYKKVVLPLPNLDQIKVYSHNIWDEEWEVGDIDTTTGQNVPSNLYWRATNYIKCRPNTTYYFKCPTSAGIFFYDADKNFREVIGATNSTFTTPSYAEYMRVRPSQTYGTTYNNDICINLSSEFNGQYEPHGILTMTGGLKSAGSVRDEIVGNKFVKKVGRVDLGTLDYQGSDGRFYAGISNITTYSSSATTLGNLCCSSYSIITAKQWYNKTNVGIGQTAPGYGGANAIAVYDSRYSDIYSIKTAMQNEHVQLDYELATPIEYEIYSPTKMPFNWKYRVSEYHTKKMLPENGENPTSAPFACEIKQI